MSSQLNDIQFELREACIAYTNLTNILIEFGYKSMGDEKEVSNAANCLDSIMKVLEIMENIADNQEDMNATSDAMRHMMGELSDDDIAPQPKSPKQPHSREQAKIYEAKILGQVEKNKLKKFLNWKNRGYVPVPTQNTTQLDQLKANLEDQLANEIIAPESSFRPSEQVKRAIFSQVLGSIDKNKLRNDIQYFLQRQILSQSRLPAVMWKM